MFHFFLFSSLYLLILFLSGFVYTCFALRITPNYFLNFILGYFMVSSATAIYVTGGITMAWGIVAVLLFLVWQRSTIVIPLPATRNHLSEIAIIGLLFTACFLSKYLVHFNSINGLSNIPYRDYVYYINHCEFFSLTGMENKMTSKNLLFPDLSFREVYRFQDCWPMALLLRLLNDKTIDVYYLVLYPVNFFLVSYSALFLLRNMLLKIPTVVLVVCSFLFLFYQASDFWVYKTGAMMMGVTGYTKLWLHYTLMAAIIYCFNNKANTLAILFLLLLFFTVPVTLSIPLFVTVYVVVEVLRSRKMTSLAVLCFALFAYFVVYYYLNKQIEYGQLHSTVMHLQTANNFQSYLTAIGYKALLLVYLTPVIVALIFVWFTKKELPISKATLYPLASLLSCGYATYVLLNQTNDSLQLYSNVAAPVCALLSFTLILSLFETISRKLLAGILTGVFMVILTIECYRIHTFNAHYRRDDITGQFSEDFISSCKRIFDESITNPVGIYLDEDKYGSVSEQHVRDTRFNATLLLGRYADVVNIKGDSIVYDSTRYKKIDVDLNRLALTIFKQRETNKETNSELAFIREKNIQYLLSLKDQKQLPIWLNEIIVDNVYDPKSGLHFYLMRPEKSKSNTEYK